MTSDYLSVNVRKPFKFSVLFPVHWTAIFHAQIWQCIVVVVNNVAHRFHNEGKPVRERNG